MKKLLTDIDVYEKRVLLRVDFNVPIKDGKITSDVRIREELPTIKYLLEHKAKLIVCSHLGRPDGKPNKEFSLKIVFEMLQKLLPETTMFFCPEPIGKKAEEMANNLKSNELMLLENMRFLAGEETNSEEVVDGLCKLADIFVFDAFGTAHRKHASTYGIAKKLPSAMGFLVQKEVESFEKALSAPQRPFVAILGGAKVSDKIDVVKNLLDKVDTILIGGGMCFTFLKSIKGEVGSSLVDGEKVDFCYDVIKTAINKKVKIILPVDFVCSTSVENEKDAEVFKLGKIPQNEMGLDIGPKTVKLFKKYIKRAKTIVWNGPMGVYEKEMFANGTKAVAELIAKNKRCLSIAGGGDVVSAIEQFGLEDSFSHISTGGGASLKLLEGKELPAINALSDKWEYMKNFVLVCNFKMNCIDKKQYEKVLKTANCKNLVLLPNFCDIKEFCSLTKYGVLIGAQDVSKFLNGAHTGEISAQMLKSAGASFCLVAHSERKKYNYETLLDAHKKIENLLSCGITPIVCVGEENIANIKDEKQQMNYALKYCLSELEVLLDKIEAKKVIVAYEPIWAIGTNKTATPEHIKFVAGNIKQKYDVKKVLYGGSLNAENFDGVCTIDAVDGFLLGKLSLNPQSVIDLANKLEA